MMQRIVLAFCIILSCSLVEGGSSWLGCSAVNQSFQFSFPRDVAGHFDLQWEWWWYVGTAIDEETNEAFGLLFGIWRGGLFCGSKDYSTFATSIAVGDISAGKFKYRSFNENGTSVHQASDPTWFGLSSGLWPWAINSTSQGRYHITGDTQDGYAYSLRLNNTFGNSKLGSKGFQINETSGLPEAYHLAQPLLPFAGSISTPRGVTKVQGQLYLQHMWGNWPGLVNNVAPTMNPYTILPPGFRGPLLGPNSVGQTAQPPLQPNRPQSYATEYGWYVVQLNSSVIISLSNFASHGVDHQPNSFFDLVDGGPDRVTHFGPQDGNWTVQPSDPWTSKRTGQTWYTQHILRLPSRGLRIVLRTRIADNEVVPEGGGAVFYDAASVATGEMDGKAVSGLAWTGLNHYTPA